MSKVGDFIRKVTKPAQKKILDASSKIGTDTTVGKAITTVTTPATKVITSTIPVPTTKSTSSSSGGSSSKTPTSTQTQQVQQQTQTPTQTQQPQTPTQTPRPTPVVITQAGLDQSKARYEQIKSTQTTPSKPLTYESPERKKTFLARAFDKKGFVTPSEKIQKFKKKIIEGPPTSQVIFQKLNIQEINYPYKEELLKANVFKQKVLTQFIPESPAQLVVGAGVPLVALVSPPAVGYAIAGGTAVLGGKVALDKSKLPEERVVGAIGAVASATTLGFGAYPFIKGISARFSPSTRTFTTTNINVGTKSETINVIQNVPSTQPSVAYPRGYFIKTLAGEKPLGGTSTGKFDINIIPAGRGYPQIPGSIAGEGAVIRGGFGFTPKEQALAFQNKFTRGASAQVNFKPIKGEFVSDPTISKYGTFFSPADPLTNIPQARISRIGLVEPFKLPNLKDSTIGFAPNQPRILVTTPTKVSKYPTATEFKLNPKMSTELEITTPSNLKILGKSQTIIKGQRVNLYEVELTGVSPNAKFGSPRVGDIISSSGSKTIIPASSLYPSPTTSSFFKTTPTKNTIDLKSITVPSGTTPILSSPTIFNETLSSDVPTKIKTTETSTISRGRSSPTTPIISPPISPPPISPPISPPPISPPISPPPIFPRGSVKNIKRFGINQPKILKKPESYQVAVRRFGKFQTIGTGVNLAQAQRIGQERVSTTLGATYKITGRGISGLRTPKGFKKKKDREGILFIEDPKFRLSTKGEKVEIFRAKRKKRR